MSEEFVPSLTLDPNPTAAAVQEAMAEIEEQVATEAEAPAEKLDLSSLSPAEQAAVEAEAEEMADLICHLVAPGHGYLTGVDIIHDGGKTALAFAKQMM